MFGLSEYVEEDGPEMDKNTVLANRLERHRLIDPIDSEEEFIVLLRQLQPVNPIYYTCPGDPPCLWPRATFDDKAVTDRLRATRELVKGRFLGDGIGYVLAEDLQIYANAFWKPVATTTDAQREVLASVQGGGPFSAGLIKEATGMLSKKIMPALHKLQKAFIVFEDQSDSSRERPWDLFKREWPDVEIDEELRVESMETILLRFLSVHVFMTSGQIASWSRMPVRFLKVVMQGLTECGRVALADIDGMGEGYMLSEDMTLKKSIPKPGVFMLHKADPIIRVHMTELKKMFEGEVLQYLLIDGDLAGAVMGHARIGPHDVDDVQVLLSPSECKARRDEIIAVVSKGYHEPRSKILRYAGKRT